MSIIINNGHNNNTSDINSSPFSSEDKQFCNQTEFLTGCLQAELASTRRQVSHLCGVKAAAEGERVNV